MSSDDSGSSHDLPDRVEDLPKPPAVEEAEATLRRYGITLGLAGAGGTALYFVAGLNGLLILPFTWWLFFLLGLVAIFFFPPARKTRSARALLKRYDELKVDQALESEGVAAEPRVRAAEAMASRLLDGPALEESEREVVRRLLESMRRDTRDLRVAEAARGGVSGSAGSEERALSDLIDTLEARATRVPGALAEIHSAAVRRERTHVESLLREAEDLLIQVEAREEVTRLLARDRGEP